MADAKRDKNFRSTLLGVSSDDGLTPILLEVDPATGRLLVDVSGSFAKQIQDDTFVAGDDGTMMLAVRKDNATNLATADGNYTPLQVDANGALRVSGGGGGTEYSEDAATPATIVGNAVMAERDDTLSEITPVEGDWGSLRLNANGALWVTVNGSVTVSGSATGAALPATAHYNGISDGTNLVGAKAIAHGFNTVTGITAAGMVAEFDDASPSAVTENQFAPVRMSSRRELYGQVRDAAGNERGLNVDANGEIGVGAIRSALPAGTNAIGKLAANSGVDIGDVDVTSLPGVAGDTAADAADAGNPVKIGGKATDHTATPTEMSAANDRVNALFDRVGRQAVYAGYPVKSAVINCSTNGNNTIVAAVAGKLIRVLAIAIVSDGTTDVRWESGADGTALTGQIPLQTREGYTISNPFGLFDTASNTLLNLELTAGINVHGWVTYIEVDD
jgi:hypothetical protein